MVEQPRKKYTVNYHSQNVKMELHIVDLHEIIKKLYSNSGQRISSI